MEIFFLDFKKYYRVHVFIFLIAILGPIIISSTFSQNDIPLSRNVFIYFYQFSAKV